MLTRSAYFAQNSTSCETMMIVTPRSFSFFKISANCCLKKLSMPFVGSSRSRIFGSVSSTFASAARCCSPPERSYGCWESNGVISHNAATSSIRLSLSPLSSISRSSSRTVFFTNRLFGSCGSRARLWRNRSPLLYFPTGLPSMSTLPRYGLQVLQIVFNKVDFPVPFPPTKECFYVL